VRMLHALRAPHQVTYHSQATFCAVDRTGEEHRCQHLGHSLSGPRCLRGPPLHAPLPGTPLPACPGSAFDLWKVVSGHGPSWGSCDVAIGLTGSLWMRPVLLIPFQGLSFISLELLCSQPPANPPRPGGPVHRAAPGSEGAGAIWLALQGLAHLRDGW
jgi:hypothetical protein